MSAMRLESSFFASLPNFKLDQYRHAFQIDIPEHWKWFFLNKNQLFLFFQDPVHLVTKWRNRLLSTTADLCLGNDKISMAHVENLINHDNYTKLDRCLTKSDINPKDRQIYHSCIKLISDDVLNLLNDDMGTNGTVVYLTLLKMLVKAYIDRLACLRGRRSKQEYPIDSSLTIALYLGIQSAWCVVIVCRLWWCYLETISALKSTKVDKATIGRNKEINRYFITRPAYLSVELNAHNLLYMVLLVKQKHLPKQALNSIHLFNSQACKSLFRDVRSLTGTFSTKVNFTGKNVLRRSQKLSILSQLKYNQSEKGLSFPIHHKHKREHLSTSSYQLDEIDTLNIEQIISSAYDQAMKIAEHSKMFYTINQHGINSLNDISKYIFDI
jgi:hypothetical protein